VLEALRNGDATLTTICLLGPHLTIANCRELLAAVRHKSKRDVAAVVDRALTLLVEELERRKLAAVGRPRAPQSVTSESRGRRACATAPTARSGPSWRAQHPRHPVV
jgi:hypothetical protein